MDTHQIFASSAELELVQRDIINDFLNIEGCIPSDIDILSAKLCVIVNLMKITQHNALNDLEYIYKRLKTFKKVALMSISDNQRITIN